MYFWKLNALKQELVSGSVTERERLLYLLWLGSVNTAAYAVPLGELNFWDHVDSAVTVLGFLLGTWYLYYRNRGSFGRDFLTRYVSMNWVFGIRFTVLVGLPAIFAGLIVEFALLGDVPGNSTAFESAVLGLVEVVYFLRLGYHFGQVSSARVAA